VEAQHLASTRKLVHTLEEQGVLEELVESVKPPDPTRGRLHYLLATPFRYPPLAHGSRFGTRFERGIWYGSATQRTAFAEAAYYRLLFLEGTEADLGTLHVQLTAFRARARAARGVNLVAGPFDAHKSAIASKNSYRATQALGAAMRASGVEVFTYPAARDSLSGVNIAIMSPAAFAAAKPHSFETWACAANRERVEFSRRDYLAPASHTFLRREFLVKGRLPAPAP
jgi:hypothetical protein